MPVPPSDEELLPVIESLKQANPTLGIAKFHSLLLNENPQWTVSEKRIKKILGQLGLGPSIVDKSSASGGQIFPQSQLNQNLKLDQWTCKLSSSAGCTSNRPHRHSREELIAKVAVKQFGKEKGKGLVATQVIEVGEEVWKEDPFVVAPEW